MSATLEITGLNQRFPFRAFINNGSALVCHHWHKEVEIIFARQGTTKIGINNELIHLEKGEFFIINSGDIHYFLSSPDSIRVVVQFDLTIFEDTHILKENNMKLIELFDSVQKLSWMWQEEIKKKMIDCLNEIHREYTDRREGYELAIRARLYDILLMMYREAPQMESKSDNYCKKKNSILKLEKIFGYIEMNYQNAISLNSAAEYIGFTPTYFAKFFKRHTGITFWNYVSQYRVTKAQWHLYHEDIPITEISYMVGFTNVKTFNRIFKDETGLTPTEYRKRQYLRSIS